MSIPVNGVQFQCIKESQWRVALTVASSVLGLLTVDSYQGEISSSFQ